MQATSMPEIEFALLGYGYTVPVTANGKKPGPCKNATQRKPLMGRCLRWSSRGEVLAVMGPPIAPSGAGKSTLLSMLALESKGSATASGSVTLNGKPFTKKLFSKYAGRVASAARSVLGDADMPRARVARGRSVPSSSASDRLVAKEALLTDLGLVSCADTIAGNELIKGLSGGQRRRLSLAVTLAKRPMLVAMPMGFLISGDWCVACCVVTCSCFVCL